MMLHRENNPVRLDIPSASNGGTVWWFPDGGAPVNVPLRWSAIAMHELAPGAGWVWATDNRLGRGHYQYCLLQPGNNSLRPQPAASSLGIYFPFESDEPLPGTVMLVGVNARAGIEAVYPDISWVRSGQLPMVATQVDAMPPGDYRLIVMTLHGEVETPVTIGDSGAEVHLQYPPEPEDGHRPTRMNADMMRQHELLQNLHELRGAIGAF